MASLMGSSDHGDDPPLHVVLFPFMSKGHAMPFLQLARLLVSRKAAVTFFTTPANRPFISDYLTLGSTSISVVSLPFPENIVPKGIENTDQLPDMSLWVPFARATRLMKPDFEHALESLPGPPVTFMVTDGFLFWTLDSANRFGIPRLFLYGMNQFASTVSRVVGQSGLPQSTDSDDEPFAVPQFPWLKLTRNDFDPVFTDRHPAGPHFEFVVDCCIAADNSFGQMVNSFYELESVYADYWNENWRSKLWLVGPLCLAEPSGTKAGDGEKRSYWMEWLDGKLEEGKTVLYVAFGSQAEISPAQFREIKVGLEKSQVNFLWVVRKSKESDDDDGFEEKVKGRGLVVREWVDQSQILGHRSVQGFLSHCGWNSALESICAKVPILAWPMAAEQPLNARLVVEDIKVGVKVETRNGSVKGFVTAEGLEKSVRELMEGEVGKEVKINVKEVGESALRAVQEGGSSWKALDELLKELHAKRRGVIRQTLGRGTSSITMAA